MRTPQEIATVIKDELKKQKKQVSDMLNKCGLSVNFLSQMKKGTVPSADRLYTIAQYLDLSVDFLLGETDDPYPPPLIIPDILKNVPVAFHRGEFEDLTQDEVDSLARIATEYKAMREKHTAPKR